MPSLLTLKSVAIRRSLLTLNGVAIRNLLTLNSVTIPSLVTLNNATNTINTLWTCYAVAYYEINSEVNFFCVLMTLQVAAKSDMNRMTPQNLGVVFGPSLLWASEVQMSFASIAGINKCIELLIRHYSKIFVK